MAPYSETERANNTSQRNLPSNLESFKNIPTAAAEDVYGNQENVAAVLGQGEMSPQPTDKETPAFEQAIKRKDID